ncbi:MAG: hypothetical protein JKY33_04535, partial [Bacteroidia bacterium]|nr:hypothetical protein [Bacteroidia bacterium]
MKYHLINIIIYSFNGSFKNNHFYRYCVLLFTCLLGFVETGHSQCTNSVKSFSKYWCQSAPYPTDTATVSFAIYEVGNEGFKKGQSGKTIELTLPVGFEFYQGSATASVANSIGGDITAATFTYLSATVLEITPTIADPSNQTDTIFFDNFQIFATASGSVGDLLRTGGAFKIDGASSCPDVSLGSLIAGPSTAYDSSRVSQTNTTAINQLCGNQEILEIKVSVSGICPRAITQFYMNTSGDAGFTQNPTTNLSNAKIYFTDTTQGFATTNLFGSTSGPNGSFSITGSQLLTLGAGDYYFYLTYSIPNTSTASEQVDARLDSLVFDGSTYSNTINSNPTGTRTIASNSATITVTQSDTNKIYKSCGKSDILMIELDLTKTCLPRVVDKFYFSTVGDAGFSQ